MCLFALLNGSLNYLIAVIFIQSLPLKVPHMIEMKVKTLYISQIYQCSYLDLEDKGATFYLL